MNDDMLMILITGDFFLPLIILQKINKLCKVLNFFKIRNELKSKLAFRENSLMLTVIVLAFIAIILLVIVINLYFKLKHPTFSKFVPNPTGYPFLNNFFDLMPDSMLDSLEKYTKEYGKLFELYAFSQRIVVISDVDVCYEICLYPFTN
jgi:hypothetical protein